MIQAPNELSKVIENINEAKARTMIFFVATGFPSSKGDDDTSTDILDVEGYEVVWKVLVAKAVAEGVDSLKVGIVNFDSTALEVRNIQERTKLGLNLSATFIDRLAGTIDLSYRLRRLHHGVPARNCAVLGNENEECLLAGGHLEAAGVVKDGAGWS
jgi:hypothetical protein